jgi:hypothetical protein
MTTLWRVVSGTAAATASATSSPTQLAATGPSTLSWGQTLGKAALLGWYSEEGGQIGDIPMTLSGGDLSLIMQEVKTADGSQSPVQFMWSNAAAGPEGPIDATH